jgi:transposase
MPPIRRGYLSSWAGICPGNNQSAGKRKGSRIKKANKFLLAALVEASWAAVRKKDSALQRKFHRWLRAKGEKKTNVAISPCGQETHAARRW